ncbi:MAG: hypothetical protein AB1801_27925, partial [Chloroflexota bacterium]
QRLVVGGRFLIASSAILAAVSIPAYPLTAIDLFIYAIRSRGWALYGLNPLSTAPEQLPADPWLGLTGEWVNAPSPYGPVWEWLSLGAYYLSRGDFLTQLLLLKILAALAYLGCVWLVYRILRQLRPAWAVAGTIAVAWNPLVLLESVQNGHNDILMTMFLLAAIRVMSRRWRQPAYEPERRTENLPTKHPISNPQSPISNLQSPTSNPQPPIPNPQPPRQALNLLLPAHYLLVCLFLALSILVKFMTALVVPFFLIALAAPQPARLRRVLAMGLAGLLIAGLVVGAMLPLWPGWADWAVLQAGHGAGRSLLALLVLALRDSIGVNAAFDLSRNLILLVFAIIYLYFLLRSFTPAPRAAALQRAMTASFFVLFWYVLLVAPVFHAWYLLWFVPLASLLLPARRPLDAAVVFSVTALLIIPYFETVRVWFPALLENQLWGHLVGVPLLIGPPALALFWPIRP